MAGSTTLDAPSDEARAEAEAALKGSGGEPVSIDALSIADLVGLVKGDDTPEEQSLEAMSELESRADDGIEEAAAALRELGFGDPPIEGAPPAPGEAEAAAAARVAEGLPEAADANDRDVDLSEGIELQIPGLEGVKLSFSGIGGKKPDESWLRVVGGAFPAPGQQFEKGQDVHVELRLRVTEVAFADTLDAKTAQATTSKRVHKGRVIGATVIEQAALEKLEELTDAVNGFLDDTVSRSVLAGILGRDDEQPAEA